MTANYRTLPVGAEIPTGYSPLLTMVDDKGGSVSVPEAAMSLGLAGTNDERRDHIHASMRRGLPILAKRLPPHGRKMVLCCYGPSLKATWKQAAAEDGDLWTTSGANGFLYSRDIVPVGHVEIDPRPFKASALDGHCKNTHYNIASRCAPEMFDAVAGCPTTLFHLRVNEELPFVREVDPVSDTVPTGITAGVCAVQVGIFRGYRRFSIHGMDCSYEADENMLKQLEPGQKITQEMWDAITQHAGYHYTKASDVMVVEPIGSGRVFATNLLLNAAIHDLFCIMVQFPKDSFVFHGDGLMQTIEKMARTGNGHA